MGHLNHLLHTCEVGHLIALMCHFNHLLYTCEVGQVTDDMHYPHGTFTQKESQHNTHQQLDTIGTHFTQEESKHDTYRHPET